jgi:hypothetical protein
MNLFDVITVRIEEKKKKTVTEDGNSWERGLKAE